MKKGRITFFLLLVESQGTIIEIGKHRHLAICWGSTSMRNQGISHSNSFSSSTLSTQQPRVCSVSMTRCYGSGSVQSSNINGLLQFQKLFSILASLVAFLVWFLRQAQWHSYLGLPVKLIKKKKKLPSLKFSEYPSFLLSFSKPFH